MNSWYRKNIFFLYVHQLHHIIKFVIIAQFEHAIYNIVNKMY